MSISNLVNGGIRNPDKQIIQRPIALVKNEEFCQYAFDGNIPAGGAIQQFIFNTTINQGTAGYLPIRIGNDIQIQEDGLYLFTLLVENLQDQSNGNKYRFFLRDKTLPNIQYAVVLFDSFKKTGTIGLVEYRYTSSAIANFTGQLDLIIEGAHIDGTEAASRTFRAFVQVIRLK